MHDRSKGRGGTSIAVIIPTFRRDAALAATLQLLQRQTLQPTLVLVVDNAARDSCERLCRDLAAQFTFELRYVSTASNGGPAGATTVGFDLLMNAGYDWIVRADDDSPSVPDTHLERTFEATSAAASISGGTVGAVGSSGACYQRRSGRLLKPAASPSGLVEVDYLATGFFPFYSSVAVRATGGFRDDLFFGYDEVEYGLRLKAAGFAVYRFDEPDEVRRPRRPSVHVTDRATWRRYYSLRNQIVIAMEYADPRVAARLAVTSMLKPTLNVLRSPRLALQHFRVARRAVVDAYRGNMGRTVEPPLVDDRLGQRPRRQPRGRQW
jgi:GT2 family glycosyltransferase